jgi:hypothetical protein
MVHDGYKHIGGITTVRHAVKTGRLVWAFCAWCGHHGQLDPRDLAWELGDVPFDTAIKHLYCTRCKKKGTGIMFPSMHSLAKR